jgi:heptose I phosphotransferase
MNLLLSLLPFAAVGLALLGAAARRRRAFVLMNPDCRALLRRHGLTAAEHFLSLPAAVVGGHPGRHVARLRLADGNGGITVYLKRESRIFWRDRLASALAGFGWSSRSLREARALQALRREGVDCPEWVAAGEDGRGRAFLLVRAVAGAADLRTFLGAHPGAGPRRRAARALGAALARLHAAGFTHPDLYAKHVLVNAGGVCFLDWQRARRSRLDGRRRARDLAALHATLADDLAGPRERLRCLRAYLAASAAPGGRRPGAAGLLPELLRHARRLLRRRHVREKQRTPLPEGAQEWRCLDGDALCAAPGLHDLWPDAEALRLLGTDAAGGAARRWLTPAGGPPVLLEWGRAPAWPWRGTPETPEQRQAELLRRLQRHGAPAPRVLAMGRRRTSPWRVASFVLTRPDPDVVRLTAWLARQLRPPETPDRARRRRAVLLEAGALLHRLHDAGCRLRGRDPAAALAVRAPADGPPAAALAGADHVRAGRRPRPGRARRDLAAVCAALAAAGCGRTDVQRFRAGYRQSSSRMENEERGMGNAIQQTGPDGAAPAAAEERPAAPATVPCSLFPVPSFWGRLVRGARRLRQDADWAAFAGADWPDRIMDVEVTDRFHAKQGRSTGRWVLHVPGAGPPGRLAVYLKRHYRLPWWQGLLATLWPGRGRSPAFREWEHLEQARRVGVPVPRAVAAAEYVGPWGRLRSFLAVEELHDMLPLNEAVPLAASLLDPETFRRWKKSLIAEIARLTRLLHDRRCFHKDLYLCHFFVARGDAAVPPEWRGRVHLIDLHRLGRHPWTWPWWRVKDLAQLLYSSDVPGIDARDRLEFWRVYRGPGPRRLADRWLRRIVLFRWRRYRRHNARRRRGQGTGDREQ